LRNNTSVFGIFMDQHQVDGAVDALRRDGFRTTNISILSPDTLAPCHFAQRKTVHATQSAVSGMGPGATIGGAIGLLAGIGALAVPGFGSFIAAGPIIGALAGAAAAGTVGGVAGGLIGLGMHEHEARHYEDRIQNGGILISVHCDDAAWGQRAGVILESAGARDIASTVEVVAAPRRRASSMAWVGQNWK
jgi:hypothetical protein